MERECGRLTLSVYTVFLFAPSGQKQSCLVTGLNIFGFLMDWLLVENREAGVFDGSETPGMKKGKDRSPSPCVAIPTWTAG
ncbi:MULTISPECIES: hypothetical protein [Geobacter]|uniref:Uncharacterized protein n=1 Tax=Geobacter anodireducens TaxID=1340425 RepID=A0ABR9NY38_9BACT|nr:MULTISPECIES: hypothetical protein [Geobacter]MBE2889160.1 hypothetical protein [Geobacter anodireducens]HMN01170.1 hypothetical protein [Geobacter anodireducens]